MAKKSRTSNGQFAKGVSGNPGGRPLAAREFAERCREYGPEALKRLLYWMRNDDKPRESVLAARTIIERGYGLPMSAENTMTFKLPSERDDQVKGIEVVFVTPSAQHVRDDDDARPSYRTLN